MTARRLLAAVLTVGLALGAAGCAKDAPDSVGAQAKAGQGYVAGSGAVETLPADRRAEPITLTGTTLDGQAFDLASWRGKVVVLNVWGSWCPPCVAEMPGLEKAWQRMKPQGVQMMGLNYRESAETGAAFARAQKITYPSLADDGGRALLALQGKARTTPTTLVLDTKGRIAARVSGEVDENTLVGLVDDVRKEG